MFTIIAKFLSILNSDAAPSHIALAISLALIAGMNSLFSVFGLVVVLLIIILRVNLSALIVAYGLFAGVTLLLSGLLSEIGVAVLSAEALQGVWQQAYQFSLFRFAELNNSLVMGQFVMSLVLFIPVFLLALFLVIKYRVAMQAFVEKFKVVQSLKASKFYQIYQNVAP